MQNKISKTHLLFSGTLGDAFIVLCKLYGRHKVTGEYFRLTRFSSHPQMDGVIEALFKAVSFAEYVTPCQIATSHNDLCRKLNESPYDYINAKWDSSEYSIYPDNQKDVEYNPFPELNLEPVELKGKNLGIQLHCGTVGHNFRGFSVNWVVSLAKRLENLEVTIHVLGTGSGYNKHELEQLGQISNIRNWVGKTKFLEWLSLMKSMDAFISLEGFSDFFAMSQRVPTFLYNQYIHGIMGSIHPAWRDTSRIVNLNSNRIISKLRSLIIHKLGMRNLFSPRNHKELQEFLSNILEGKGENAEGNR